MKKQVLQENGGPVDSQYRGFTIRLDTLTCNL